MEFKFRAGDDRPPPYLPPSSSFSYYSERALRANYSTSPSFMGNQRDFYTIQREIEKDRIRQEIIAEENIRRRMLEEEVRRELMMEREMAMHREAKMGLSIEERLTMRLDSRFPFMHQFNNRWLPDRLAFPGNRSLGPGMEVLPPVFPQLGDAMTDENKTALEVDKKDKLIILAKPKPNLCGAKRKAATPPSGAGELPITSLKKNKIEEWSCALCQVSATSERGLNEHLRGKKHKAKEKALRTQKMQQKNSTASLPKKQKSVKAITFAGSEPEMKVEEKSLQINKRKDGSDQKMENGKDLNNKKSDFLKKENGNAVNKKKKNGVSTVGKVEKTPEARRKKFKFWCEICQVGAYSEVVMETHMNGKKHMFRTQKHKIHEAVPNKNTRTTITTNMVASLEPTEKVSDVGAAISPEPIEKAGDVDAVEPIEKASDVDTLASPVCVEKASDVTAATSPERAKNVSDVTAPVASPECAEKAGEVADATALLWLLGRRVI
ncbi:hypothetical protein Patl1_14572 [Pistacia atlantica]|uniref:Uncharacterized protein n=1 Tax=Pistacia atlantica TaxID=434234 RepID=A0ACC1AYB8_9ROSI|nr:hypothetical protein Patl1_14572 [Pistacia atlantica]